MSGRFLLQQQEIPAHHQNGNKRKIDCPAMIQTNRVAETNVHEISKHRTCWFHLVACCSRQKKVTHDEFEMLKEKFETCSPCMLHLLPLLRRKRSVRKAAQKEKLSIEILQNKKLDSGAFEHYLQNLWSSFSEDKKISFTYLDSLWFTLYLKASHKDKVLKWVKDKHIFSKKYVFVPIVCWSHWSLLIFCHLGTKRQLKTRDCCMLLLDSLELANPRRLEPDIRKFVSDIYRAEGRSTEFVSKIPLMVPKVPQQRNEKACGIFVLYFMNLFMEDAPKNFSIRDYPYFMEKNWFTSEDLDRFCERLLDSL